MSKFTVLLSIYKKEKPEYFEEALTSIYDNQVVKPSEIIIVEDGKLTDELYKVVKRWKDKLDEKLKIISLEKNVGLAKALNIGLHHSSYELVARMDTDDIAMPDRFQVQYEFMNNNHNVALCGAFIEEFNELYEKKIVLPISIDEIKKFAKLRNPIAHPTVIFRKSIIKKVGGYPEELRLGQDFGLWSVLIANGYKLYNIPTVLVRMRVDNEFLERRGWESFKYEILAIKLQYKIGFINLFEVFRAIILRSILRMSPVFFKKIMYKILK